LALGYEVPLAEQADYVGGLQRDPHYIYREGAPPTRKVCHCGIRKPEKNEKWEEKGPKQAACQSILVQQSPVSEGRLHPQHYDREAILGSKSGSQRCRTSCLWTTTSPSRPAVTLLFSPATKDPVYGDSARPSDYCNGYPRAHLAVFWLMMISAPNQMTSTSPTRPSVMPLPALAIQR
jgi:hypothetical protein